jgi:hypothetical protein
MNSLAASSISWAKVQARVQPPRPLSPRWAKDRAKALQDIYWRMRLVNLAGVLADGTTWSVSVPPEEKKLAHVNWWDKRWVQFNFSSPVASNFMVYARGARTYLDDMEKTYKNQIDSYNGELKRLGFELAEPGDPDAFLVKVLHKTEGGYHE